MQALWMLLGAFSFALMGVCIKYTTGVFHIFEVVAWRGLVGGLIMLGVARSLRVPLRTRFPGAHLWRSIFGVSALTAWFYTLAYLPLATAMTFNYMSSIWIAVFTVGGAVLLGRVQRARQQWPLLVCILLGFVGVYWLLQPDTHTATDWRAALLGLASGFLAAIAYLQLITLGRLGEPEIRTVFIFSCATALGGAALALTQGVDLFAMRRESIWLLAVGVFAVLGQLCITRAYRLGTTLVVANLQYAGLVFSALLGFLFLGETLSPLHWAGMALIIACGVVATILRARAIVPTPVEAKPQDKG